MIAKVKVPFKQVAKLVRQAFPGASSRRPVGIEQRSSYTVRDFWDGGSRDEARFVNLATGEVVAPSNVPALLVGAYQLAAGEVSLAPGFAVVEHTYFCGKDLGYRVYTNDRPALDAACPEIVGELAGAFVRRALLAPKSSGDTWKRCGKCAAFGTNSKGPGAHIPGCDIRPELRGES
jgi:hypothetical protein